jgi:hypothetical protein
MKGIVFREFIDMVESCFEQSMSRTNGCLELSQLGLGSGDWYVRHQSGVRTPRSVYAVPAVIWSPYLSEPIQPRIQ